LILYRAGLHNEPELKTNELI